MATITFLTKHFPELLNFEGYRLQFYAEVLKHIEQLKKERTP